MQVNNNTLVEADHHRAVAVLKEAGNNVTMVVAREVLRPGVKAGTVGQERQAAASSNNVGADNEVEIKVEVRGGCRRRALLGLLLVTNCRTHCKSHLAHIFCAIK